MAVTIIVEDGTQVTGANSYVTRAELIAYASDRGTTLADDATTDNLIIPAMDYLEAQDFQGIKMSKEQPLQWPRAGAYLDTYLIDGDEIPNLLKEALMEIAITQNAGVDPNANVDRVQKRVKVGDLEVEYADGSSIVIVKKVLNKLRKLLATGGLGSSFVVKRG